MAPYKFRYYQPDNFQDFRTGEDPNRRRSSRRRTPANDEYGRRYYDDSTVTETDETSYVSDRATPTIFRSVTPEPSRDEPRKRRRRKGPGQYDHHLAHIHYISPRLEPALKFDLSHRQGQGQPQEMAVLKTRADNLNEPRITMLANRKPRRKRRYNNDVHICPEKSSKNIPSMYYDELRCPHCAAHIQPAQEEVLAYPWSVQSYRPKNFKDYAPDKWQERDDKLDLDEIDLPAMSATNGEGSLADDVSLASQTRSQKTARTKKENAHEAAVARLTKQKSKPLSEISQGAATPQARSVADFTDYALLNRTLRGGRREAVPVSTVSALPPSKVSAPPLTELNGHPFSQSRDRWEERIVSTMTPPVRPMFRPNHMAPNRSDFRTDNVSNQPYLAQNFAGYENRRLYDMSVREDDITPFDSVSNVLLPPLRAAERESIMDRKPAKVRAATDVNNKYTTQRFFQSMDRDQPKKVGLPTPRPGKDTASEISRMLRGEYYDRRTGRVYEYNINYSPRKIHSERRP